MKAPPRPTLAVEQFDARHNRAALVGRRRIDALYHRPCHNAPGVSVARRLDEGLDGKVKGGRCTRAWQRRLECQRIAIGIDQHPPLRINVGQPQPARGNRIRLGIEHRQPRGLARC